MAKLAVTWLVMVAAAALVLLLLAYVVEKLCYGIYRLQNRIRAGRAPGK